MDVRANKQTNDPLQRPFAGAAALDCIALAEPLALQLMLLSEEMREFLRKDTDLLDGIASMLYVELQVPSRCAHPRPDHRKP
jgi:hypothetical protein